MKKDALKRKIALLAALLILGSACFAFAGCTKPLTPADGENDLPEEAAVSANEPRSIENLDLEGTDKVLRALVLYKDENPAQTGTAAVVSDGWRAAYTQLSQSLLVNMTTEARGVFELARTNGRNIWDDRMRTLAEALEKPLAEYDLIYLDPSVTADEALWRSAEPALKDWVKDGGFLFVANASVPAIDKDFLGIKDYKKLNNCPTAWTLPDVRNNLSGLQEILGDYLELFKNYRNSKDYKNCDFGYVLTTGTAVSLADLDAADQRLVLPGSVTEGRYAIVSEPETGALLKSGVFSLAAVNRWGDGFVLTASGLLPNDFTVTSFDLAEGTADRDTFINTTASACRLLRSEFASFASKERFGYAVERLFGSDGQPSIAWQLHYEEETGIANGSALLFADLAEANGQIPSYTLVRNAYTWFKSAATVTYVLGSRNESGWIVWEPDHDPYENAYDSGTHFIDAGTGRFLEFNSSGNGSYFTPNPWDLSADYAVDVTVLTPGPDGTVRLAFRTDDGAVTVSSVLGFEEGNCVLSTPEAPDPDSADSKEAADAFLIMDLLQGNANHFLFTQFETPGAGEWVRETSCDLDGDGLPDTTVIGNADGYLGVYTQYLERPFDSVTKWRLDGYLGSSFGNAFGNNYLKFGQYACPAFADLNGDGIPDLIVGHREYGVAYPVDSPYFPERGALKEQIDALAARGYYIGAHLKTTVAASDAQEKTEFELHRQALEAYGIDTGAIGANHHTWISSNRSLTQTFRNEWETGFLWDSGWKAANNTVSPEVNAENVLSFPFFLVDEDGEETILLWNTSTVGYDGNGWSAYAARYDMPLSIYYHCDLAYLDPEGTETFVKNIGAFAEKNGYRWVSEDTLAKEIAAAYNVTVEAALLIDTPTEIMTLSSGDPLETKERAEKHIGEYSLRIRTGVKGTDKPLYDAEIQSRASVRIEPGECFVTDPVYAAIGENGLMSVQLHVAE